MSRNPNNNSCSPNNNIESNITKVYGLGMPKVAFATAWYLAGWILAADACVLILDASVVWHRMEWPLLADLALRETTVVTHVAVVMASTLKPILQVRRT